MQRRVFAPAIDFDQIRRELDVTEEFPAAATAEAESTTDRLTEGRVDRTDINLVTIDPPGSKDLDQALHIEATDDGFTVHYAIADVAALVAPGGPIDTESLRRGQTIYFPDGSVPLHPRPMSEGVGSLLPDQTRPAVLWTVTVNHDGDQTGVHVERATVRSRERLDYAGVMAAHDAGTLHPSIAALPAFGQTRIDWALRRGAVQLDLPDQEIVPHEGNRAWTLQIAPHTPADQWNAQVSLLVGMAAGRMQRDAGVGLLRTLPPASREAVDDLRAAATHLGVAWADGASPGEFLASLPADAPTTLALMSVGARLMRGAGYLALDESSAALDDAAVAHAGVGGVYSHVTAPLRRLGDRYATETCLAIAAGQEPPQWVLDVLPTLPKIMASSDSTASTAERRSVDLTEAVVLADQIGARFDAVVMRDARGDKPAEVFISSPAIIGGCEGAPAAGTACTVEVVEADPTTSRVRFRAV
ncbi:VacB and RNase II family 3'-5' exoribonucleases [Gordonia malaquae]|uniref:Putative ribonuclease n=1 Tax=Gordonia malaquae NBRC 108250 TaxID=1223542 RepID=M3TBG9_GORML|nr:RNB domain-containing ribonuclease [Gordonia malaquae]GAC78721.1 putative ribonuclease [Gordonia malaquae NBRC 108250]SED62312.1 VacB and RNase II family 3'-5' exoribonucleases [Gordonia malaquae]